MSTVISRFYIVRSMYMGGFQVLSGPYISREVAEAFVRDYDRRVAGETLTRRAFVASRAWVQENCGYPFTPDGEECLQKLLDRRRAEEGR